MVILPSFINQLIDLQYKSIYWFLYEGKIAMKKVNSGKVSTSNVRKIYER